MNDFTVDMYKADRMNVEYYPSFLEKEDATRLYDTLEKSIPWTRRITERSRVNCTFGEKGLVYTINFRGKITHRPAKEWTPELLLVKKRIESLLGEEFNICVAQRYPSGAVGINPHRDKEMVPGTSICGISLGAVRELILENKSRRAKITLGHGSLYVLHPPTNDYYTHSIPKDASREPRISLTFRNYK